MQRRRHAIGRARRAAARQRRRQRADLHAARQRRARAHRLADRAPRDQLEIAARIGAEGERQRLLGCDRRGLRRAQRDGGRRLAREVEPGRDGLRLRHVKRDALAPGGQRDQCGERRSRAIGVGQQIERGDEAAQRLVCGIGVIGRGGRDDGGERIAEFGQIGRRAADERDLLRRQVCGRDVVERGFGVL